MIVDNCGEVREHKAAYARVRYQQSAFIRRVMQKTLAWIAEWVCIEPVFEHILFRDHDPCVRVEKWSCNNEALRELNSIASWPC